MIKKTSFWFMLFMVLVVLALVVQAPFYHPSARLFPLLIGIPTLIAGVWILLAEKWPNAIKIFDVRVGKKVKELAPGIEAEEEAPQVKALSPGQVRNRFLTLAAWTAGYMAVIVVVGFTIANFLLPAAYIKVHGRSSWWKAIIIGAVLSGIIWVSFDYFVKAQMYKGILFGELIPPF